VTGNFGSLFGLGGIGGMTEEVDGHFPGQGRFEAKLVENGVHVFPY
jgi:hypothetical protein